MIHPTSIIDPKAEIDSSVVIGPYCRIDAGVKISAGCQIEQGTIIKGLVEIGANNIFGAYCTIGFPPQDTSYKNEPTKVMIGESNRFADYVSIHRGTLKEKGETKIGNKNFLMNHAHVAHDVVIGDSCTLVNSVQLGGHVKLGNKVTLGGGTMAGQFVRIGDYAYIGGGCGIDRDIPPFFTASLDRVILKGINIIGMRRAGFSKEEILSIRSLSAAFETNPRGIRSLAKDEQWREAFGESVQRKVLDFCAQSKMGVASFHRQGAEE
jgi:UDP-N-acetylglucosamine acyltransferase